ncbi:MAG: AAA family ATPase [Oscillospiraceae bacterium]|nr:AAA family ATPase [Oscillospiraceae bacterium]
MPDGILVKEAAARWKLTEQSVTGMCRNGKIPGAFKEGGTWYIPADAEKPADGRVRSGAYKKAQSKTKLPLPVGISDYRVASTEYYYVDKTLMIKDFLDERPQVSLFTRPRRFGKTLNMDMLRTFFEKTDEDTSVYFRDKAIWKQGEKYQAYQGKYPVIFLSFKDVKCESWQETIQKLAETIGSEFARHAELLSTEACNDVDKAYFRRVMERTASDMELSGALLTLTRMLHEHHKIAPIIIIDEYDTPIQQGHTRDFYDQVILFMRNLFSGGLKDNSHLTFGFLTGILRVAKESIFSGLNNLSVYSVVDDSFSEYFGFTHVEVKQMAAYYGAGRNYSELCEWYDGYRFGKSKIFNPWSVINYFQRKCKLQAYWVSTSSNDVIGEVLASASTELYEDLYALLRGETITAYIDTGVVYPQIGSVPSSVYSFLLVTGYLKLVSVVPPLGEGALCEVALPNQEIAFVYKKEILDKLSVFIPQSMSMSIQKAIYSGNVESLRKQMRQLLLQSVSSFDTSHEDFYHGLLLGICAMMDNRYYITSNRESGEGRFDIQLMPKTNNLPGFLIEVKWMENASRQSLAALARSAIRQINEKHYDTELRTHGVNQVLKYGVAFSGKNVEICME